MSLLDNDKELFNNTDLATIYSKGFPIIGYKTKTLRKAGTGFHWRNSEFFADTVYENEFALYIKRHFTYDPDDNWEIACDGWDVTFYSLNNNGTYSLQKKFKVHDIPDDHVAVRALYLFLELMKADKINRNKNVFEYDGNILSGIFELLIPDAKKIEQHYKETDPWYGWEEK